MTTVITKPEDCSRVRADLRTSLTHWGLDDLDPVAELLTSELVQNSLRYASGPRSCDVKRIPRGVRCIVRDGSATLPTVKDASEEDETGRGMALVDTLSARWGAERTRAGKRVWFDLELEVA